MNTQLEVDADALRQFASERDFECEITVDGPDIVIFVGSVPRGS